MRAERDRKTREDILSKIGKKLRVPKSSAKDFVSNTNYRKYVTGLKQGRPRLNEAAIAQQAKRDGFFGVVTNVKTLSAQEVIAA